jgi:16S rRNA (cytosine1402-N4)-methyltransferase
VRIALNDELAPLEQALTDMVDCWRPAAPLVITFHSLEDRIAKNTRRRLQNPCYAPRKRPCAPAGNLPLGRVLGGRDQAFAGGNRHKPPGAKRQAARFERAEAEPGRP